MGPSPSVPLTSLSSWPHEEGWAAIGIHRAATLCLCFFFWLPVILRVVRLLYFFFANVFSLLLPFEVQETRSGAAGGSSPS